LNSYLLVSGGTVSKKVFEAVLLEYSFDRIIACDKGMEACRNMNIVPDVIIGDFDSAHKEVVEYFRTQCQVIPFNPHKDFTDTHAAITYAIENKCTDMVIIGATGTRIDHTWANVGLLKLCVDNNINGYIVDEYNKIRMINANTHIPKSQIYNYVSLLPYTEIVEDVYLSGFEYNVSAYNFHIGDSIGISNTIQEDEGIINMKSGYLLVVESHD
jgi:thiamine pyrophosphokinase